MRDLLRRVLPCVVILTVFAAGVAFAATEATSDGKVSEALAQGLYCSTGDLLEGNIGLLLGLILVFMGVWSMVNGGKLTASVPMIIMGALITALPSLVESSFEGLGALLKETNISKHDFSPPDCKASGGKTHLPTDGGSSPTDASKMLDLLSDPKTAINPQTGVFYPGAAPYFPGKAKDDALD